MSGITLELLVTKPGCPPKSRFPPSAIFLLTVLYFWNIFLLVAFVPGLLRSCCLAECARSSDKVYHLNNFARQSSTYACACVRPSYMKRERERERMRCWRSTNWGFFCEILNRLFLGSFRQMPRHVRKGTLMHVQRQKFRYGDWDH